ncbi:MAG TPA: AMP-binding protein, partial [Rhodocyclaceae bacterium]|nr:AMP-binding protein [Rhodocyclaceae bacterium]
GSTGVPQAHDKTWGKLTRNILGGAQALWHVTGQPAAVIGTVPSQHMYGFESTVLLPLLSGGILHAEKPFFPADILASLSAAPQPRALITTPFHLKTLLESDLPLPPIDLIVSATAPLSHALAERAEQASGATLLEIYGSTETGQIATRRTVKTAEWRCYADIRLEQRNDCTWASGGHIEMPIALNDVLELRGASGGDRADDNARFILHGRHSDLVNIAGKRTSLAYLNHILNSLPGVVDGVFHLPDEEPTDGIARLNAFVVAPGLSVQHIVTGLREYIDPVFIPRPLVMVDALPRNSTGKLTSAALKDMSARYASQGQS